MSANTKIEWCDHTQNFWEGCQKAGPGCDHCYAEARNARFGGGVAVNWGPGAPRRRTSEANWRKPLAWNANHDAFFAEHGRRQRVFCSSLADVFDNAVDPQWRADMMQVIADTPNLDWLLLTKRIGNARAMLDAAVPGGWTAWPNVWMGATIVNQPEANRDIVKLLAVPAAKWFLSMEPLLGAVDLSQWLWKCCNQPVDGLPGDGYFQPPDGPQCCGNGVPSGHLSWVIVGGESGPGARPMHPDWARSLRDQCEAAGVPYMFKQWGEHSLNFDRDRDDPDYGRCDAQARKPGRWINLAGGHGFNGERVHYAAKVGKKTAGRLLDGRTWDGVPA